MKRIWQIYVALMVLLVATVGVAYVHLGPLNVPIALAIAFTKAILVILFFMHVKASSKLIWIFAAIGFLFFGYMVGGTLMDYHTRGQPYRLPR